MRDVAEAFNKRFGETLVVPEGNIPTVGARVRDLKEPERKMSTTGGTPAGTVYVDEEPDVDRQEVQEGRRRQRLGDRRARRQARHLEHDRDPGRGPRRHPGRHRARVRGLRLRHVQDRRGRGSRRVAVSGARELPGDQRGRGRDRALPGRSARRRPARSPPRSWPTCARPWASGPSAPPPSLGGVRRHAARAGSRRLRRPLRPAPLADPARGAGPARGGPGGDRRLLPGPPRVPRSSWTWSPRRSSWC